ncbi:hypothetical protein M3Y94_00612400 [Aphelenchoides besseyi]|nr:hypothetical protein M3Y94_00612400 [Aphelenchoides besseyi]KAI6216955.1 hypothetical protein M3Y95_01251100 [Aphelenchoides besseyi]KAI6230941.1 hypothetical protein M3Y95_00329200 [Aphelenchoides besseyi]
MDVANALDKIINMVLEKAELQLLSLPADRSSLIRSGIFNNEADDTTSIRSTATKSYGLTDASLIKRSLNAAERQLELLARDAETEEVKPSVQTQPSKQPKAKRHRRGCRHRK